MPSLTIVKDKLNKIIKYAGAGIATIVVLFVILRVGVYIKNYFFPPPPEKPTVAFGKIPHPSFPENREEANFTYKIDTLSGNLPSFPHIAIVYKTEKPTPSLGALSSAENRLNAAGFSNRTKVSESRYRWINDLGSKQAIIMDVNTGNFSLSLLESYASFAATQISPNETIINTTQDFLISIAGVPQDLDRSLTKITLLTLSDGNFVGATSVSRASFVRVDLHQQAINEIPIVYEGDSSSMSFLLGGERGLEILSANYFHQKISKRSSTYPIKTASEAFEALKNGEAYFAIKPENGSEIFIKEVELGYFMPNKEVDYILPVIVFKGEGFMAYVSAVRDEWTNN